MTEQKEAKTEAKAETKAENKRLPEGAPKPPGDVRRRVERKKRTGPFVKYVGPASHRSINPTQWNTLQIELNDDEATHVWNVANDKMLEADLFSDEQLDYLLVDDKQPGTGSHSFLAVDYDKDGNLEQVEI
jgi:hypothetical protein